MFLTTTVLNFTPLFRKPVVADTFTVGMLHDIVFYGAKLYSFVVMPDHVHLLCQLPDHLTAVQFMQRIKSGGANRCLPLIADEDRAQLKLDPDASHRTLWKSSFRSYVVTNRNESNQKVNYIDNNPAKKGLVGGTCSYRWWTARFYNLQRMATVSHEPLLYTDETGWDCLKLVEHFPDAQETDLRRIRGSRA